MLTLLHPKNLTPTWPTWQNAIRKPHLRLLFFSLERAARLIFFLPPLSFPSPLIFSFVLENALQRIFFPPSMLVCFCFFIPGKSGPAHHFPPTPPAPACSHAHYSRQGCIAVHQRIASQDHTPRVPNSSSPPVCTLCIGTVQRFHSWPPDDLSPTPAPTPTPTPTVMKVAQRSALLHWAVLIQAM